MELGLQQPQEYFLEIHVIPPLIRSHEMPGWRAPIVPLNRRR
jgi:hypothetical protein